MNFKIGDKVKVINKSYTYPLYEKWINNYASFYNKEWKKEEFPDEKVTYRIVAKSPHISGWTLYLIQNIKTKQVYIIDKNGIKLVKENQKFFKTLPNDFTGTIEVENGYILENEILDKEEKEYLSAVIRPFKDRVNYIAKQRCFDGDYYICIDFEIDNLVLPYFKSDTMYKGMELYKEYTLKELGLDK